MALVLEHILGPWGSIIIGCGLLVSVSGAFLSWTVLATEAPLLAAQNNMFPKSYAKENSAGTSIKALNLTIICIQISLFAVIYAGGTYNSLLIIASEMILAIPIFLVAAYTLKLASIKNKNRGMLLFIGAGSTIYGIWLLYASGLSHLLLASLLYLPGLYFLHQSQKRVKSALLRR